MLKLKLIEKSIVFITGVGFCGLLLFHKPVNAQVNVSPLVISTETKQGIATGFITLTNKGNETATMYLSAAPFTYSLQGFQVLESSPNDLSPYLVFSPKEVVIEPKQTRRVRILARLLPSMKLGEYRAAIFAEPFKPKLERGFGVTSRIGVVVYVRHGQSQEKLTPQETNYDVKNQQINLIVKNEGNVTIRPEVRYQLKQAEKEVFQGVLSPITLVAETTRNIPITFKKDKTKELIPAGNYQLTGELLWGDDSNRKTLPFSLPVTIP
jgi:P pilus assembly chaperone PapD